MIELNDTWFAAESEHDSKRSILRGRNGLDSLKQTGAYSDLIEIKWTVQNAGNDGMPLQAESDLMAEVEDVLVKAVEHDQQSVLAIVFSWNSMRTWLLYTKSVEEFGRRLNTALARFGVQLPLQVGVKPDADWSEYRSILQSSGMMPV